MRFMLISLLAIPLVVGCGDDSSKDDVDDTPWEEEPDADGLGGASGGTSGTTDGGSGEGTSGGTGSDSGSSDDEIDTATADSGKKRPVLLAPLGTALGRRLCRAWRGDRAKQRTPPPARPRADLPSPGVDRRTEAATKPRSNAAARRAPRIAAALPARPARPSCARPRLPCSLGRRRVARVPPARSCCGGRGIRCPRRTPIHATPPLPTKGATPGYEVVAGGQRRRAALHPAPPLEEGRGGSSRRRTPTSQPMMHARPVGACGALCRPRLQATASDQAARRRAVRGLGRCCCSRNGSSSHRLRCSGYCLS